MIRVCLGVRFGWRHFPGVSSEPNRPTPESATTEQGTQSRAIVALIKRLWCVGSGRMGDHVTDDRALKQAIRRRMAQTGQKYTEARRALLNDASEGERPSWHHEPYWQDSLSQCSRLGAEEDEAVSRACLYASLQVQIEFGFMPLYGRTARRPRAEYAMAAIDASAPLTEAGLGPQIERNRRILERIEAMTSEWPAPEPAQPGENTQQRAVRLAAERARLRSFLLARENAMARSEELDHKAWQPGRDAFLRHPMDNWFRLRRQQIEDAQLRELLDAWIDDFERNYAELVAGIPAAWRKHAELDFVATIEDVDEPDQHEPSAQWGSALPSPARVSVDKLVNGDLLDREEVATDMVMIEGRLRQDSEGITALAGERWHVRGHRLSNGTILPCRGSYRLTHAP